MAAEAAAVEEVAELAVVPPDEVVLQAVAPEQLRGLLPGWIQMPFLQCPALLPVVKAVGVVVVAVQARVVGAAAEVVPQLRDPNLQQLVCSF